jgi:hypothetical protein
VDVFLGDLAFGLKLLEAPGGSGTGSSLFRRKEVLLVLPLLLAGFEVNSQAGCAEPNSPIAYSRPQM